MIYTDSQLKEKIIRMIEAFEKVSNLLQSMKKDGIVAASGMNRYARWHLL